MVQHAWSPRTKKSLVLVSGSVPKPLGNNRELAGGQREVLHGELAVRRLKGAVQGSAPLLGKDLGAHASEEVGNKEFEGSVLQAGSLLKAGRAEPRSTPASPALAGQASDFCWWQ